METLIYETPIYKIGKTEWKLIVFERDDALIHPSPDVWTIGKERFTRYLWRRDGARWLSETEHPRYDSNAWDGGLPRGLRKIYEKHEPEIMFALGKSARKTPAQARQVSMFEKGDDLPLFSNSPIKANIKGYKPRSEPKQPKLPTLCPVCLNTGFIDGKKCVCQTEEKK